MVRRQREWVTASILAPFPPRVNDRGERCAIPFTAENAETTEKRMLTFSVVSVGSTVKCGYYLRINSYPAASQALMPPVNSRIFV